MGGRGVRDPVPDIREIITDRKEAGGLPSSTFLNLAPEKQEKLLSAAVREFTERPYNEASINRIVREAGIPRGSFYMYFRDKEDLFHYLMEESIKYLCARMRRGYLYKKAKQLGCNKIALGHHYDDVIETILMGMLYGGQVQTMMPKLHSTNYEGMELIRPLYLVREAEIKHWRDYNKLNFIQCACRFTDTCTTCSPNSNTGSKRQEIKQLIVNLKKINPQIESNIFHSVENVNLDTIISYKQGDNKVSFLDRYDDMGKGK